MKSLLTVGTVLVERFAALLLLILLLPTLLLITFLLRTNTDEPILLTDDVMTSDGKRIRSYRFRTTGRGSPAFRVIGRFLQHFSIDELPGVWAVVRGEVRLSQFLSLQKSP